METWQIISIMGMFIAYFIIRYIFRKGGWVSERKRISPDNEKIDYIVEGRSFAKYEDAVQHAKGLKK